MKPTSNLIKLSIELVPETCFNSNLRSILKKSEWDKIRRKVYALAGNKCEICGASGRLEAHEIWDYDDINKVQKLVGLISLCSPCHLVKHIGFAQLQGKEEIAIMHLMKINNINRKEAEEYINKELKIWEERSKYEWKQNISYLEEFKKLWKSGD